jgi:DNA-binding GntR family transcriptional regulator
VTARPLSSADWATLPRTRIVCSPVVALERLRYADDEPLAIMRNWIPQVLVELTPELLERAGLYQVMRASGIRLHLASQTIGARRGHRGGGAPAPRRQAGAGALTMRRTTYDGGGRSVEFGGSPLPRLALLVRDRAGDPLS